ncbi:hypothetical protein [Saccharibacillus kuerlensis]|uniref:Uncharacterized protein n=1 Tax=Saccharibacillus kuerlensis TaxID=459527 RepID=A0ABQ2L4V0_9BACL|nr:hypothetical protein [Saccharibacillus kuerlensis]GGO03378.1 hypothetical protein GCM10010969_27590 [Saccharibacillus kuerlensis]
MNYFWKMNLFSLMAAIPLALFALLELNIYRLERVTGWGWEMPIWIVGLLVLAAGLVLLPMYVRKHLHRTDRHGWLLILWLPYFFAEVIGFGQLLPIDHPGDTPGGGAGFMLMFMMLLYPVYVLMVLMFSQFKWDFGGGERRTAEFDLQRKAEQEEQ